MSQKLRHISSQKFKVETKPQSESPPFKKKPYSYTYCDALHILFCSISLSTSFSLMLLKERPKQWCLKTSDPKHIQTIIIF